MALEDLAELGELLEQQRRTQDGYFTTRLEYRALYRLALEARKIRRDLERVGWPIIMNATIKAFDEALERWAAVDKLIDKPTAPKGER